MISYCLKVRSFAILVSRPKYHRHITSNLHQTILGLNKSIIDVPSTKRVFFSTNPSTNKNDEENVNESPSLTKRVLSKIITPKNQFYALVAGGSLGAFIITRGFISFTTFFTHLNPAIVAKYGFYTGFGTASFLGLLGIMTIDNLFIRADPVYKYCRNWVVNDIGVQQALGDGIQTGSLRSYRLDSGNITLKEGTHAMVWRPPRIQMIFDVRGTGPPYRTGLVTCEAIKPFTFPPRFDVSILMVDFETGNEGEGGIHEGDETIYLRGSDKEIKRISRRSGISLYGLARQVHINRAAKE